MQVADRIGAAAQDRAKAVVVHTMAPDSLVATALRACGVPWWEVSNAQSGSCADCAS